MPTTGALQLAGPPTKPHAHTHTRHTHIYIYIYVSCVVCMRAGDRCTGARRLHADHCVCSASVCMYIYIYIYIHTHTLTLSIYLPGDHLFVVWCACVLVSYKTSEHTHTHTTPQTDDPHRTTPQRSLSHCRRHCRHHHHHHTHPHTHTHCVCVCVWVCVGWSQSSKQASKQQERAQTRSFGVCTANQTHTDDETRRRDWIITRPHCPLLLTPVSGPHLLEITLE